MSRATLLTASHVLAGLAGIAFLVTGGSKVLGAEAAVESFRTWGYPAFVRLLAGAWELAAALLLLAPQTRREGSAMLVLLFVPIALTHAAHEGLSGAVPALVLVSMAVASTVLRGIVTGRE